MTLLDSEFDLDLRLSTGPRGEGPVGFVGDVGVADPRAGDETVAPEATCPADTCELGCETSTCADATCGCNTDTCDQVQCSDAITFGDYCEDASGGDDTCDGCPGEGPGGEPDDPDDD